MSAKRQRSYPEALIGEVERAGWWQQEKACSPRCSLIAAGCANSVLDILGDYLPDMLTIRGVELALPMDV